MTNVTVSSEALQAIVERSIIEGLTADEKETLLGAAIKDMVTPKPTYGGRESKSLLASAIESAVSAYTHQAAQALLTDDVKAQIDQLVKDGIAKAVSEHTEFTTSVATAAGAAIEKALRGY